MQRTGCRHTPSRWGDHRSARRAQRRSCLITLVGGEPLKLEENARENGARCAPDGSSLSDTSHQRRWRRLHCSGTDVPSRPSSVRGRGTRILPDAHRRRFVEGHAVEVPSSTLPVAGRSRRKLNEAEVPANFVVEAGVLG